MRAKHPSSTRGNPQSSPHDVDLDVFLSIGGDGVVDLDGLVTHAIHNSQAWTMLPCPTMGDYSVNRDFVSSLWSDAASWCTAASSHTARSSPQHRNLR